VITGMAVAIPASEGGAAADTLLNCRAHTSAGTLRKKAVMLLMRLSVEPSLALAGALH